MSPSAEKKRNEKIQKREGTISSYVIISRCTTFRSGLEKNVGKLLCLKTPFYRKTNTKAKHA